MDNINFWTNRVKKYGHTNWGDVNIFAFDQSIRTNIIAKLEREFCRNRGGVLDFGCGEGDHVKALGDAYEEIVLFDPCSTILEKAKVNVPNYSLAISTYDELFQIDKQFDLILSITVLQHIMTDSDLKKVLDFLNSHLSEDGIVILLESFSEQIVSSYERKWNYTEFDAFMRDSHFTKISGYNFYNPYKNKIYSKYRSCLNTRFLNLERLFLRRDIKNKLEKVAEKYNKDYTKFIFPFTMEVGVNF